MAGKTELLWRLVPEVRQAERERFLLFFLLSRFGNPILGSVPSDSVTGW